MPEGDTIFRAARTLHRALAGQPVTSFESVLPHLTRVDEDERVVARTIEKVTAAGKWLLIYFSGDLILLSHMLMSGSWHIYRPGEKWHRSRFQMRVLIGTPKMIAVGFNILVAEFHNGASLDRRDGFNSLGPSFLTSAFDESEMISRLRSRPDLEIGVGLLSQSLISGIGNVYKSEVCFACGVNPFRKIASLTDQNLECLVKQARNMMLSNVQDGSKDGIVTYLPMRRTTGRFNPSDRLWVYRRAGERCRRCGGTIMSRKQGIDARTSFWCPSCQPIEQQRASA